MNSVVERRIGWEGNFWKGKAMKMKVKLPKKPEPMMAMPKDMERGMKPMMKVAKKAKKR